MSLRGDAYETAEEVRFRLENTIVKYDGSPVYITRVEVAQPGDEDKISRVTFSELPFDPLVGKGKPNRRFLSSKKFDLTPFKMGYMNHKGDAFFVSRAPIRQQKQGLSSGTCSFANVLGKKTGAMDFSVMTRSSGFGEMVEGKYPTFYDAGGLLDSKETNSVAVSRSFAFYIDHGLEALFLLHKGVKCGLALRGHKTLSLPEKFHFLREEAEECKIPLS